MQEKLLEQFGEIRISKEDISSMGKDNFAFLSTTLYAANEIFVFYKFMVANLDRDNLRESEIQALAMIQQTVILRNLSAKLFEFIVLFEAQSKNWARSGRSAEIVRFVSLMQPLAALKSQKFYKLTETMRNKITNHYITSYTSENIEHIHAYGNLTMQMNAEQGNSFFPVGEEVVFLGGMNKHMNYDDGIVTFEKKRNLYGNGLSGIKKLLSGLTQPFLTLSGTT